MDTQSDPIRPASAKDEAQVAALARKIENFLPEDFECIMQLWQDYLHGGEDPDRYHFLVFEEEGKILSFACFGHRPLTQGAYDYYWLATDPDARGRGIGGKMTNQVEAEIRKLGGYIVLIETSDSPAFQKTRSFHEANGYIRVGEIADFYAPGDGLVMYQKRL
jgi:ribosomal protein S18 acetylase RimI-like enzyme